MVESSFNGATSNVNDSIRLIGGRAYAVTDGGTMHVLDALNLGVGAFNTPLFSYQTADAVPIKFSPYIEALSNVAYFGDNGGKLYVVNPTNTLLSGFPFALSGAPQITSSPVYLPNSGVVAVGASDGYVYFIDRQNGSNTPVLIKKYYVGTGSVSSVAYNYANQSYMVSSSDGKLSMISSTDVPDPTSGTP
jgi:hypothetical protein